MGGRLFQEKYVAGVGGSWGKEAERMVVEGLLFYYIFNIDFNQYHAHI